MQPQAAEDPRLRDVLLLALSVAGLGLCLTLMFFSMRAVMDVGGYCAEGGPYVIETHCPEGATPALLLGIFGLFGFGGLGMWAGAAVGGYGWLPLVAWTGLFASLGWNFLDYGLFNPPDGEGIVWGWLIPGVMFEIMAWVPVGFVILAVRDARRGGTGRISASPAAAIVTTGLRGPGQPARRTPPQSASVTVATGSHHSSAEEAAQLREIASLMGVAVADAAADAPMDPDRRATAATGITDDGFSEGTQALLDRLERLADMRDRGLLTPEEFETAKEAVMHELAARS